MIYSFWRPVWLVFHRGDGMIMSENVGQVDTVCWGSGQGIVLRALVANDLAQDHFTVQVHPMWKSFYIYDILWYSMIFYDCVVTWLCGELCRKEEHNHRNTFWPAQLWRVCPDIMKSRNLGVGPKLSQQTSGPACRLQWLPQTRLCSLGKSCTSGEPGSRRYVATKCTSMSISRTPWRSLFPNIKSYIRQILQ